MTAIYTGRSEFDCSDVGIVGINTDMNTGKRHISVTSITGVNDDDLILTLSDVGWAGKVVIWPQGGGVKAQNSIDGVTWTTGGVLWRKATASASQQYTLTAATDLTSGLYFIDGAGPSFPFLRFRQEGATPVSVHVFLQT